VISDTGEKIGPIPLKDAVHLAKSKNLDLLLVSPNPTNPVTKIIDYGKYKYDLKKQEKEQKKKQVTIENREIRIRTGTGEHDLEFKAKKVRDFLESGSRIKISLKFRGREVNNIELGYQTLNKFFSYVQDIADIDKKPKLNKLFLDMYIMPKKIIRKEDK
jgi:translation initiation factor IF-3